MRAYLFLVEQNTIIAQKNKYACIFDLTCKKTPTLSKKINMHAHLIKYACIYILTSVSTIIKQKKYACIFNLIYMHIYFNTCKTPSLNKKK